MYQLKQIGLVYGSGNHVSIKVNQDYIKAWKYVDQFSHIHIFMV